MIIWFRNHSLTSFFMNREKGIFPWWKWRLRFLVPSSKWKFPLILFSFCLNLTSARCNWRWKLVYHFHSFYIFTASKNDSQRKPTVLFSSSLFGTFRIKKSNKTGLTTLTNFLYPFTFCFMEYQSIFFKFSLLTNAVTYIFQAIVADVLKMV